MWYIVGMSNKLFSDPDNQSGDPTENLFKSITKFFGFVFFIWVVCVLPLCSPWWLALVMWHGISYSKLW